MVNIVDELVCLSRDCEPDSAAVLVAAAGEIRRLREVLRNTLRALEEHLSAEANAAGLKHCSGLCPCWDNEGQQASAALAGGGE